MGISFKCSHCGESFTIGEDAYIVRHEDTITALSEAGLRSMAFMRQSTSFPDLITHFTPDGTPDKSKREEALAKVAYIIEAIAQGKSREWYCGKCRDINEYAELRESKARQEASELLKTTMSSGARNKYIELRDPRRLLDNYHALSVAKLCFTPQSPSYLRQELDKLYRENSFSGERLDQILKYLESYQYIEYDKINNQWKTTQEAINYIKNNQESKPNNPEKKKKWWNRR